jgi:hypothetical protein
MNTIQESSFRDLYRSTVSSFPKTTKRQNSIDPIKIVRLEWTPYLGLKTLYLKGLAQNTENSKEYYPIILFKGIKYSKNPGNNYVEIRDSRGKDYILEKIDNNEVLVRCNCNDFFWRGNYADHLDGSLYGRKRAKYFPFSKRESVNPNNNTMVCKHIIKLYKVLGQSGIIT